MGRARTGGGVERMGTHGRRGGEVRPHARLGERLGTQAAQLKPPGIAEAVGEGFGRPVGVCEDPVDFAGEGAVEDAGVVCANSEVDV